jgi:DNA-binding transcriptional LysR family regulator
LSPALERINLAVAETRKQREKPAGRIRLIIPRAAIDLVLMPKLSRFVRNYPDITFEVTNSSDPVDLVAGEFDAGIQIGEFIHRDMIAVPVTKELRLAIVGSPAYFQSNPIPQRPADLKSHSCVGFRFSNGVYRWEFKKGRTAVTVSPQGPVSFDESDLVAQAVLSGIGVGAVLEESVKELILKGKLKRVLQDWCPVFPGFFLYYPSRRNQPGALAAFIQTLRLEDGPSGIRL